MRVLQYILLFFLITSCSATRKVSLNNLANLYNDFGFTRISMIAFHANDSISRIYVSFNLNDLIYEEVEGRSKLYADYTLRFNLFPAYDSQKLIDSASYSYLDSTQFGLDTLVLHDFSIGTEPESAYLLQLKLTDNHAKISQEDYLEISRDQEGGRQDFLLLGSDTVPLLKNYVGRSRNFILKHNDPGINVLHVRYYNRNFPVAVPPFVEIGDFSFDYTADSIFHVPLIDGYTGTLRFEHEGFYHFQSDTSGRAGFTVFRYYEGFPRISTEENLYKPLRYITSDKEFNEIRSSGNVKLAVDRFWLENSGNAMRARNMIKKFYGRVEMASRLFSSYHEGWKTDRGMLYIVFGPPNAVYRLEDQEEWIYGETGHMNAIKFQFVKVINPFTGNDFRLIKSPAYKEKWYNAVENWRR